jgi:hypothetical protein
MKRDGGSGCRLGECFETSGLRVTTAPRLRGVSTCVQFGMEKTVVTLGQCRYCGREFRVLVPLYRLVNADEHAECFQQSAGNTRRE